LNPKTRVRLLKAALWLIGLSPLAWGLYRAFLGDQFGANPIEAIERYVGRVALASLLVALTVTPLRRITRWNDIQKTRRLVGLFAFFYLFLHFLVWICLVHFFNWSAIGEDLVKRPFIYVGFTAFLLLIPLALTSTKGWIRRLGKNWVRLHSLIYIAVLLGVVHYFWATKADDRWPTAALVAWLVLMVARLPKKKERRASPANAGAAA
jgi:methionine sulfoxide reductase heme-binding subunit